VTAICSLGRDFIGSFDEGDESEDRDEIELRGVLVGGIASVNDAVCVGGVRR